MGRWREEMRSDRAEMMAEIRRSNDQLLAALNRHTHDDITGAAEFSEVPAVADD